MWIYRIVDCPSPDSIIPVNKMSQRDKKKNNGVRKREYKMNFAIVGKGLYQPLTMAKELIAIEI